MICRCFVDAWPGVDLQYVVTNDAVKETLLIKTRAAAKVVLVGDPGQVGAGAEEAPQPGHHPDRHAEVGQLGADGC